MLVSQDVLVHWYALQFRWTPHQAPQDVTVEHYSRKLPVSLLWHAAFNTPFKSCRPGSHLQGWSFAQTPCQFETEVYIFYQKFLVHGAISECALCGQSETSVQRSKGCDGSRLHTPWPVWVNFILDIWFSCTGSQNILITPRICTQFCLFRSWVDHPHFSIPTLYFFKLYIWSYVLLVRSKDNSRMLFSVFTVGDWLGTCCTFLELRTYSLCCFVDAVLGTDGLVCPW